MVTVLIALALLVVGIAGTLIDPETVGDLIGRIGLSNATERDVLRLVGDRTIAYACLFGSPMLLVIGSLLPGI
jgi:hypothetical protein